MSPSERNLFQSNYIYTPSSPISQEDPCVKFTNICTTILLLILLYFLLQHLSSNPSPLNLKDFLYKVVNQNYNF
jgi:hypothetical protein